MASRAWRENRSRPRARLPAWRRVVRLRDGELRWSRLYREDAGELDAEPEHKRQALTPKGWSEAD